MKRLLVLVAVLVPLSFFTAGCGGAGGSPNKSATAPSPDKQKEMMEMMQKGKAMQKQGVPPANK